MPDETNVVQLRLAGTDGARGDWRDQMCHDSRGRVLRIPRNAALILTHDPAWEGVIAWDDFRQAIVSTKPPPWDEHDRPADMARREWVDSDFTRVQSWLARHYSLTLAEQPVAKAVVVVAEQSTHHEVREYLEGLRWDGYLRVPHWASRYLGAGEGPYSELISTLYLISAVARIMSPGCKADSMIVLEGEQGARKSTALRTLFGDEWFADTPLELESKDRFVALRGKWCVEWAELDAMRRVDMARIKSFLSSSTDTYRPPYGRGLVSVPRQCVFAGTTNPQVYLRDETGNRRFWPIKCGTIDVDGLKRDRDQLWAEAAARWASGERWWPEGDELGLCREEQEDRMQLDPWEDLIASWLTRQPPEITTEDVLAMPLAIEAGKRTRTDEIRVGTILLRLGWSRIRKRIGGRRRYVYVRDEQ